MGELELLAPARNADIGIAAIDCGADAVYIAGPKFGARQSAGNEILDIERLCTHAHRYGARIFITLNTIVFDDELQDAFDMMSRVRDAGADAVIVQDLALLEMAKNGFGSVRSELGIPLHASTQCAIRTPQQAVFLERLGFSRLILERQLSLEEIGAIKKATSCELEFFVHGALCVCYSGQCYLSEKLAGRSANRGECIQACRSNYDLVDEEGRILAKNKALLSLKDYNLKNRLRELAEAGISSFKIEGRLKNESYVKNAVLDYSAGLDAVISACPGFSRASFGKSNVDFTPDMSATFNRGYTELFIDGKRGKWASYYSAGPTGEEVGTVVKINGSGSMFEIRPANPKIRLNNGDGFCFIAGNSEIKGVRGDVCEGMKVQCKSMPDLFVGAKIFRNYNAAFEKKLEQAGAVRSIGVQTGLNISYGQEGTFILTAKARSEDGREASLTVDAGKTPAENRDRMSGIFHNQLGKSSGIYGFSLEGIDDNGTGGILPLMPAGAVNEIRRKLAAEIDAAPCRKKPLASEEFYRDFPSAPEKATYKHNISNLIAENLMKNCGSTVAERAYELTHKKGAELMRTRYCIKYETGMCPKYQGAKPSGRLFLLNNGRRLALHFDCGSCEMTVTEDIR